MSVANRPEDRFLKQSNRLQPPAAIPAAEPKKDFKMPKMTSMLDRVLVKPIEPKRSHGMIALASSSIKAERALTVVGQVVDIGSQAYVATPDGLNYGADRGKISVGSWVLYRKHAGQPIRVKKDANEKVDAEDQAIIISMEDRDILAVFESEEDANMIWHWVGT